MTVNGPAADDAKHFLAEYELKSGFPIATVGKRKRKCWPWRQQPVPEVLNDRSIPASQ